MKTDKKITALFVRFQNWYRKTQTPGQTRRITLLSLLLCPVFLLFLCLLIGTQSCSFFRLGAYFRAPLILVMNFLPIALVMWTVYLLTNRAWLSWLLTSVPFLLLTFINYFKVDLRGEPLVYDDFLLIGEGAGIMGQYNLQFPLIFFLSILLVGVGTWHLRHFAGGRLPLKLIWLRLLGLVAAAAIALLSWSQWYTDYVLYTNTRLKIQDVFSPWRDDEITAGGGLFWSLLRSVDEAHPEPPQGYTEEKAVELLSAFPEEMIPENQRVNVIATMLESFSDLSAGAQVSFTRDPYKALHELEAECYSGTLVADSVGGGTVNAERSFLTGFTYRHPNYERSTPSFVYYFAQNGYSTQGAHPGHDWFYSRSQIDRRLGFESYSFAEDGLSDLATEEENYHGFAADRAFFAQRRQAYLDRDKSRPYFDFNVTFQGHSPYAEDELTGQEYVSHEGLSDEAYYSINNYLSSVADTGRQISAFVDSFREDSEPVVLVFFGDHKPNLGTDNSYLEELGVLPAGKTARGRLSRYTTPYLIWANDAAKKVLGQSFSGEGDTISPCYLMSEVFDCCGWTGPSWLQFQRSVRDDVPVMHMKYYVLSRSGLTQGHTARARKAHDEYNFVEYYVRLQQPN